MTQTTNTARWTDLVVYDNEMNEMHGRIEDIIADADNTAANYITLNADGSLSEWPHHFIALPGETPDVDTPRGPVDWTGFADAVRARS